MDISNVLIEHLPRLKCANFFILFSRTFADISSVRVHLRPTEISINFDNYRSTIIDLATLSVHIKIDSLSLLIAKNNLISFRINIASGFREEILSAPADDIRLKSIHLNVQPNEPFHVICGNCSGPLSDLLSYRRILELPSENMDASDWFCHKHDADDSSHQHQCNGQAPSTISDFKSLASLISNDGDLLFGNHFALFNASRFTNIHVNSSHKQTHCRRCLHHIGVTVNNNKTLKLWNNNIKVRKPTDNVEPSQYLFSDSASIFGAFLTIINRITYDFQMLGRQSIKLLFDAQSANGTTTFLFVQTMARNLELYQMLSNERNMNDANRTQVTMNRIDGIKCLFLCEEYTDTAFVNYWQQDINVITTTISIQMLECVVERLQTVSRYVPEQFRSNNGFALSYLSHDIN